MCVCIAGCVYGCGLMIVDGYCLCESVCVWVCAIVRMWVNGVCVGVLVYIGVGVFVGVSVFVLVGAVFVLMVVV